MDNPQRSLRVAWTLAIGLWLVVLVQWFQRADAPVDAAVLAGATPPAAAAAQPNVEHDKPLPLASPPPVRAASATTATTAGDDTRAVCGIGAEPASPREAEGLRQALEQQRIAAWPKLVAAVRARGGAAAEAEAAALEAMGAREHGAHSIGRTADLRCTGADCLDKQRALAQAVYAQAPTSSDRLIALATTSGDPWVVWLGVRECDLRMQAPQACAGLTWRRLAMLDADNGAMWLELAAHDPGAVDEAVYRASRARRFDDHDGRLAAAAAVALAADLPAPQRTAAWAVVAQEEALAPLGGLRFAATYCNEAALRDANRAQVCEALARQLVEHGLSYRAAGVGHAIGARLGWPPAARDALRDEQQALAEAMRSEFELGDRSCRAIAASTRWLREMGRGGERAAARRWLERSGVPQAEWLRRADVRRREADAAVATAASTATPTAARTAAGATVATAR